jgi:molecular chaperone DnaK
VTPPVIGIDLGTTNSVVAYADDAGIVTVIADENGDRIVPSVIHFTQDGGIVVGRLAKDYAKVEPQRVARVFKRGMGTPTFQKGGEPFVVDGKAWTPEELSSLVLKKLANMAERHFGEPARRAVITVPYYFGEPERAATRAAGEMAGCEVLQIVNEPTAAAVAHGLDSKQGAGEMLVFDLGGGTFDVTIMRYGEAGEMDVIATSGDRELGGADFDDAILSRMASVVQEQAGVNLLDDPWQLADASAKAEEMKRELSTSPSSTRPLAVGGKPVMFTLSRKDFEGLCSEQIELVEDAILNALDKAEIDGKAVGDALMVGGSSRIPVFQDMVERTTGKKPMLTRNLDEDVARGAALLGAKQGGTLDPRSVLARLPQPIDAASHALGIRIVDVEDHNRPYNDVVIPEGTPIPHRAERTYATVEEGQTEIELVLNEGGDRDLDFCRQLGRSVGRFARPVPRSHPLRCTLEYTADQLIKVVMYDGESGNFLCDLEVEHRGLLSESERQEARSFLASADVR